MNPQTKKQERLDEDKANSKISLMQMLIVPLNKHSLSFRVKKGQAENLRADL